MAALTLIGAFLAGCKVTEENYKRLSYFFDGVPDPHARTNAVPTATVSAGTNATAPAAVKLPVFFKHPPYADRQCFECHESAFSVRMKGTQRQVCFACHDDFLTKPKFKHAPAENSECSSCHNPHGSPIKKMLVKGGGALCGDCHDDPLGKNKVKHQPVADGDCAACHQPHASDFKGLLKQPAPKLCSECQDRKSTRLNSSHRT